MIEPGVHEQSGVHHRLSSRCQRLGEERTLSVGWHDSTPPDVVDLMPGRLLWMCEHWIATGEVVAP